MFLKALVPCSAHSISHTSPSFSTRSNINSSSHRGQVRSSMDPSGNSYQRALVNGHRVRRAIDATHFDHVGVVAVLVHDRLDGREDRGLRIV
jgi:hypothetical protein